MQLDSALYSQHPSVSHIGNDTQQLLEEASASILYTAKRPEVVMERGTGMYIWDTDGKPYLDFIGGWAVNALGHSPAVLRDALASQSAQLVHASPGYYNKPMIQFAKLLTELSGYDRAFFASSGSEANESAIKLARKYGSIHLDGAYEIVTTIGSFHGRTLATMSATGKPQWMQLFAPKVPGFHHVPFNDIEAMRQAVSDRTCAIMIEPVQGEGGVHPADAEYIKELRKLCDERSILLVFDEVQTGIGRTGKLFAFEHYGIRPDIVTLAKGIGAGFPLSAMLTKEELNLFEAGEQGGTYTGQPLAMAVGCAVLGEVVRHNLPSQAEEIGAYIREELHSIAGRFGLSGIRGMGLLIGFDLPRPIGSELAAAALANGLLINAPSPSIIRLMPPLIVTKEDVSVMLERLTISLEQVIGG
ncbi:aspartate aminotransferase family protein [Paenibacillus xylaniclasticus]|uniref:aspartate aminotransferase family protein n=1 Tax=Paenibacillus xylaniclasticus TaxID=588083 RepID=UPI000FDAEC05|nr:MULTISPECIES: acetylornithine/succinylornithine family transaminase [Paenibacillus]GFN34048.1 acetylornithine aminotransferase 2 [Paenibacillus curdlanolyticus]